VPAKRAPAKTAKKAPARRRPAPKPAETVELPPVDVVEPVAHTPNGRVRISLPEMRRERDETSGRLVEIDVEVQPGEWFTVSRHVFGLRVLRAVREDDWQTAAEILFGGDPRIGTTVDIGPEDVLALIQRLAKEFAVIPGESDASPSSSVTTTTPSRPTSSATTA
jgi:hypothetical protein